MKAKTCKPTCPQCRSSRVRRSRRRTLERSFVSWLRGRPYRCVTCQSRFWERLSS